MTEEQTTFDEAIVNQLIAYQRAAFDRAAGYQNSLIGLQFGIASFAAATVLVPEGAASYIAAITGLVFALSYLITIGQAKEVRSLAERLRRATLILLGLNGRLSAAEQRDMLASVSSLSPDKYLSESSRYYKFNAEVGPERVLEMLEESAFWSSHLYSICAKVAFSVAAAVFGLFLLSLFFAFPILERGTWMTAARMSSSLMTFLVSNEVLGFARQYSSTAAATKSVVARIQIVKLSGCQLADVLLLVSDYNSAVESAPLILPKVYALRREKLDRIWAQR
jgi:hypothetical protein